MILTQIAQERAARDPRELKRGHAAVQVQNLGVQPSRCDHRGLHQMARRRLERAEGPHLTSNTLGQTLQRCDPFRGFRTQFPAAACSGRGGRALDEDAKKI